jgi:hemolysin III
MTESALAPRHYPTAAARRADFGVHLVGLALAAVGGAVLALLAVREGSASEIAAVSVYVAGLVAMFAFSMAYNFSSPRLRPVLRRLDHAGIFLMIAGSYTPFTTLTLSGAWAWAMTIAIWSIAILGALGKLLLPQVGRRFWIAIYLGLAWLGLVALKPILDSGAWIPLTLLVIGGLLYSCGVVFYMQKRLSYFRAIWHGHVVAGAAVHWCAVLFAVALGQS